MLKNEGITSNLVHYGSISPRFPAPEPLRGGTLLNWGWGMETE